MPQDLSSELSPKVIMLLQQAEAGTIRQAAKLICQFCGMRWYQFTRPDGADFSTDLDQTYDDFRYHVTQCHPEKPLMQTGLN